MVSGPVQVQSHRKKMFWEGLVPLSGPSRYYHSSNMYENGTPFQFIVMANFDFQVFISLYFGTYEGGQNFFLLVPSISNTNPRRRGRNIRFVSRTVSTGRPGSRRPHSNRRYVYWHQICQERFIEGVIPLAVVSMGMNYYCLREIDH